MFRFPLGKMFIVVLLGFSAYRIIVFASAELISRSSSENVFSAMVNTSTLNFSTNAYYTLADIAFSQGKMKLAEQFILQALRKDNSNGRAMALAIDVYEKLGEKEKQAKAVELTPKLWNSHLFAHAKLANYWAKRDDKEKILAEWNILLLQDSNLEKTIFPVMQSYLEQQETQKVLLPYIASPPAWWGRFFSFSAKKSLHIDSIQWLYQARRSSTAPLMQVEYRSFIKRLVADNQWKKAFKVWREQISADNKDYDSLVYDGGFEYFDVNAKRNSIFEWKTIRNKWIKFDTRFAFGANKHALKIEFLRTKEKIKFRHLSQNIMLGENESYLASYKLRTGGIKGDSNLRWRIYCLGEKRSVIGTSPIISASPKWKTVSFDFKVPATGCQRQLLRLESNSSQKSYFKGRFWFDDIQINKGAEKG